jgi:membrane protein YqaA with SNARE-associated domain
MGLKNRYVHISLTLLILLAMAAAGVALWRGAISVEWLASFGYKGIFLFSLINSVSPIAGPSQIATFLIASKLNPLLVGVAGGIGGTVGELSGYLFGYSFRASLSDESQRKLERFGNWRFIRISRERSFVTLFVLASIPNPFFDPVSTLAGSLRIGFARYFVPVLLGRTLRHVLIAYAGFYSSSLNLESLATGTIMTPFIGSLPFIGAVILIAFAAWLVRLFAESDPDPLILNFTFFAFAAQSILTTELLKVIDPAWVIGLLLVALVLVLLQVITIRDHAAVTLEHYKTVLRRHKTAGCTSGDIDHWAAALVRITGRDFSPQFSQDFGSGSRGKRRLEALSVLPPNLFKLEEGAVTSELEEGAVTSKPEEDGITLRSFRIRDKQRKWRWFAYVAICVASWLVFLGCILIVKTHK